MFLGSAVLAYAHVAKGQTAAARPHFERAMALYRSSKELRDRCGVPLANWDTPCAHGMLAMVQVRLSVRVVTAPSF